MIPRGFVKFRRDAVGFALREKIKKALTIFPQSTSSFSSGDQPTVLHLWAEEGDYIGIARGFFNTYLRKQIEDVQFMTSLGGNDLQKSKPISLRPGQGELIDKAISVIQQSPFGGAILEAKTGAGKTVLGLETSRRLGLKTLVVVHTSVLLDQWLEEARKFFPHYRIGILQADKIDIKNKDLVIGMLQSASMREYPRQVYEEFGTIVIDEVHKTGAPEFSKMLTKFIPKHYVGLSGTIERKDRAENVFIHGMGQVISGMNEIAVMTPQVYFIDTGFVWVVQDQYGNVVDKPQNLDRLKNKFLEKIAQDKTRNEIIIRQTLKAVEAKRNILILSERVAHVEELAARLKKLGVDAKCMVGTTSKGDRKLAASAQVICATNQLIGTGFNEPRLDTLIFASPIQEVIQPVGRILRLMDGKKTPLVLDLVDSGSYIGMVFGKSRCKRYRSRGWKISGDSVFDKEHY